MRHPSTYSTAAIAHSSTNMFAQLPRAGFGRASPLLNRHSRRQRWRHVDRGFRCCWAVAAKTFG
jgi:hypothetical protein